MAKLPLRKLKLDQSKCDLGPRAGLYQAVQPCSLLGTAKPRQANARVGNHMGDESRRDGLCQPELVR
jgi:hypothetical protein